MGLALYSHDARVVRAASGRRNAGRAVERGEAKPWSEDSARHLRHIVANGPAAWTAVLLVTLPKARYADGESVRKVLARLLDRIRKKWGTGFYLWVREWTAEATPHFHLLLDTPCNATHKSRRKNRRWARIDKPKQDWLRKAWRAAARPIATWPDGQEAVCSWEVVDDPQAAARYIGFYSAKKRQKQPPNWAENYGRWWAASQGMEPVAREYLPASEAEIIAALGVGFTDCRSGLYRTLHGVAALLRGQEEDRPFRSMPTGRKFVPASVPFPVRRTRKIAADWMATPPLSRCIDWYHEAE